ncbi:4-hydroxybenzoate polyprenyltransferase [Paenibacillus methanolicus]|uniref:4-hydroxybenzoate polyprenyltransferase n=1 Tax=Paenibacillus methanolicus TaxID=582686 RepID=A0A5S5C1X1_9BACL|nr:decaprenyl-phosphate phosphoribosyltransferase [Paenibacillus methanolicus]TYP72462.1 4-hydroxybenzoate polyprenyltransferase [Paenibacillus methanolicus]
MPIAKTNLEHPASLRDYSVPRLLFIQLRPKQWSKNALLFAALLFSFERLSVAAFLHTLAAFLLFCLVSGCVYILNDYVDREADRNHPQKKNRPMASGQLNPQLALAFGSLLLLLSFASAIALHPLFAAVLAFYFALNVSYSFKLKHVVIVDILVIAAGFVLRAIAGGIVIRVSFTPWFLLCTMLLSLFLAIGKRRHELTLLSEGKGEHRKVLAKYSVALLDQMNSIVTTATVISYSLFTFTSGRTIHLMWTIPLVLYGIFRYLYLIHVEKKGGAPDRILFEDKPILFTVILYIISIVAIFAIFE